MLELGQEVYVVCKFNKDNGDFSIYISPKQVNVIRRDEVYGVIYSAGKHRELIFHQLEDGTYQSFGRIKKTVYLDKNEADAERKARLAVELQIKKEREG